ncbi:MAG: acyltransferase family protein [Caulobacterales bacterium]
MPTTAQVSSPQSGHIGVLDGVRAVSILAVLAGHLLPLGPKFLQLNGVAAGCGMSLFFTLSGFLITRLLISDNTLVDFLVRRLARIIPLAYLYCLVVFVLFRGQLSSLFYELSFTLNYNYQYANEFNAHLWSLCIEVQFYLIVGVLFRLLGLRAKWVILALCLILTAMRLQAEATYSTFTHLRGDEILTGSILCLSTAGALGDHRRLWSFLGGMTPVLALLLLVTCHPSGGYVACLRAYAAALLVGSVMHSRRAWLTALLTSKPMTYIAKISYALYIIHPAAAAGFMGGGPKWLLYMVKRPVTLAVSFALAHLSTFRFEAWWMELGRRFVSARRAARAAVVLKPSNELA